MTQRKKISVRNCPPVLRAHAPRGQHVARLVAGEQAALRVEALHHRSKLHELRPQAFEKLIDLQRTASVVVIDRTEDIELHPGCPQGFDAPHHRIERRASAGHATVTVVALPRPVERNPYQKSVFPKKIAPLSVEQRSVGLDRIDNPMAAAVSFLQIHRLPEKIQPAQQRFASVPVEQHIGRILRSDKPRDERFEHLRIHHFPPCGRVIGRLFQVIAIFAPHVASARSRFCHQVQRTGKRIKNFVGQWILFNFVISGENTHFRRVSYQKKS